MYVVSGLGADFSVLSRLVFPGEMEVVFLDWLLPEKNESFKSYVGRMAARIDDSAPFCLLGYSFGGFVVQEINHIKPAAKIVILGSLKSHREKSPLLRFSQNSGFVKYLPTYFYKKQELLLKIMQRFFDASTKKLLTYFTVRDPQYLKWSVEQVSAWTFEKNEKVVQIMGDKDLIFPLKYSTADYVIKGGTHLFPLTHAATVSQLLKKIFKEE